MWTHGHTGVLCSHDGALGKKALGIFLSYTPLPPPHTHTGLVKIFTVASNSRIPIYLITDGTNILGYLVLFH